jgi:hypothetical protein
VGRHRRVRSKPARDCVAHGARYGALCLITALARHGLTDVIPARVNVAIPRGNRAPALRSPVDIHVFGAETFDLGREEIDAGHGVALGLYSAERSLVDLGGDGCHLSTSPMYSSRRLHTARWDSFVNLRRSILHFQGTPLALESLQRSARIPWHLTVNFPTRIEANGYVWERPIRVSLQRCKSYSTAGVASLTVISSISYTCSGAVCNCAEILMPYIAYKC